MKRDKEFKELDEVDLAFKLHEKIETLQTKLTTLEAKLQEAEKVIEFYGDYKNWHDDAGSVDSSDISDARNENEEGLLIGGKRARTYLQNKGG